MKFKDKYQAHVRALTVVGIAAACLALQPASSNATDVGLRVGYYFDADALSVGMEMLTPLDDEMQGQWFFNPNVELAMGDVYDVAAFNLDFHYDFPTMGNAALWMGAGPGLLIIDRDRFRDDTDVDPALNLLAGLGAKHGRYRPFIQGKGIISDNNEAELAVGIRF